MDKNGRPKTLRHSLMAALILALSGMGDAFLYVYLPSSYRSLGLTMVSVGLILSVNRFSRLFLNSYIAYALGRFGLRPMMGTAVLLALISTFSYGFLSSLVLWLILRILWGIAFSTLRLGSLIYALEHHKRGISLGLSKSLFEAGSVAALLLGPLLLTIYSGRMVFVIFAAIGLSTFIVLFFLPRTKKPRFEKKDLHLHFPSSFNIVVLTNSFIAEGMLIVLAGKLLSDTAVDPVEQTMMLAAAALGYRRACIIVFSPLAGWLADKWGFTLIFDRTALLLIPGIMMIACGWIIPGILIAFTFSAMNSSVAPGGVLLKDQTILKDVSDNATWRDIGAASGTLFSAMFLNSPYLHILFLAATLALAGSQFYHFRISRRKRDIQWT